MRPAYRSTSRFAVHRLSTMSINRKVPISFPDTKNAPGHESAPGPCRYTHLGETAPSTHAWIVSGHVSAARSRRRACRLGLAPIALPAIARLGDGRRRPGGRCHALATAPLGLDRAPFACGALADAVHGAPADIPAGAVMRAAGRVDLAGTPKLDAHEDIAPRLVSIHCDFFRKT